MESATLTSPLSLGSAAAPLAAPAAALHVHETTVAVAVVLALTRVRPAAFTGVEALLSSDEGAGFGGGGVRGGRGEDAGCDGEEEGERGLHFCLCVEP